MTDTVTCKEALPVLLFILGGLGIIIGTPMFCSARDNFRSGHIIAVIANVVEQQQVAANCVTVVNLAPGINATVTEAWTCDRSVYVPQRLIPVCHKWQDLLDFTITSWDSSHEQPQCMGYAENYDLFIAGTVVMSFGVFAVAPLLVTACVVMPCLALIKRLRAGGRVADNDGTP